MAKGLEDGVFTSLQLVQAYIRRIEEVDHIFHTVVELNPDALTIASKLDEERRACGSRGRVA